MNKPALVATVTGLIALIAVAVMLIQIENRVSAISDQVLQQSVLVNRSLGKVLPYELPREVDIRIKAIESRIADITKWPKTPDDAETLRQDLASVVANLPPWIQEEILPRLVPLRWNVEGLWLHASEMPTSLDGLSGQAATLELLLANRPLESSNEIAEQLKKKAADTDEAITALERDIAVAQAKHAIETKEDVGTAIALLSAHDDAEAQELRRKLSSLLLLASVDDTLKQVRSDLKTYDAIQDPELQILALERLKALTTDLQLKLVSADPNDTERRNRLQTLLREVSDRIATTRAAQMKAYQVWALQKIKAVRPYEEIEKQEIAKISDRADRALPLSDARLAATARARAALSNDMIAHLAPIDQSALDIAVSQLFRTVYAKRFDELKDEKIQLEVVTAFANTPKKAVEQTP